MKDLIKLITKRRLLNNKRLNLYNKILRLNIRYEKDPRYIESRKDFHCEWPIDRRRMKNHFKLRDELEKEYKEKLNNDKNYLKLRKEIDIVRNKLKGLHVKMKKLRDKYNVYFMYNAANHITSVRERRTGKLVIQTNLTDHLGSWSFADNPTIWKNYHPINVKAERMSIWEI